MGENLEKLLAAASSALSDSPVVLDRELLASDDSVLAELVELLRKRNGFYAFESALHVFPSSSVNGTIGLDRWNAEGLWRASYGDMASGCLFFAEDVFGGQFCIKGNQVYSFDPETGGLEAIANSLEAWAKAVIVDYEVMTGYPLAHAWQEKNGPLPQGKRLVPKVPFVVGGKYELGNLYLMEAARSMQLRGELANQIKDLPDGAQIQFQIVD
jgi:hypothetical protein